MSTRTDAEQRLADDIEQAVPQHDPVVMLWSGAWMLSHYFRKPEDIVVDRVIGILLDVLGDRRTLVMPTYTFGFPRDRKFDLVRSEPDTGAIARRFMSMPGVIRTRQPVNSYAARGPQAEELAGMPCTTAWGDDSAMGWMERHDARQCILGVSWKYCGYLHRAEEILRVPYRYFKRFSGTLYQDGREIGTCEETMYVRSLQAMTDYDSSPVPALMKERGYILIPEGGSGLIQSARTSDVLKAQMDLMSKDALTYVIDRPEILNWIESGKSAEIAGMAPESLPAPQLREPAEARV